MTADAAGGIWTYASDLRAALEAAGVEVRLVVLGPDRPPGACDAWLPGRLEWQPEPWEDLRATGAALLELADGVDLVHLNSFGFAALPFRCPVIVVGHSDVLSWHRAVRGADAGPEWDRYRDLVAAGLAAANAVVAPTRAMLAALRRHYGVTAGHVIANGVDHGAPPLDARAPFVLAAGRLWDEAKGLDALDAAAGRLGVPVRIAGAGGTARHAELLGPLARDELRALMGRAAVFAHPARYEPFGLVVAEAAAAGCPLVLGDIDSLRELWDGEAAFVAPGDAGALAAALADPPPAPRRRYALDPQPYLDLYAQHVGVAA